MYCVHHELKPGRASLSAKQPLCNCAAPPCSPVGHDPWHNLYSSRQPRSRRRTPLLRCDRRAASLAVTHRWLSASPDPALPRLAGSEWARHRPLRARASANMRSCMAICSASDRPCASALVFLLILGAPCALSGAGDLTLQDRTFLCITADGAQDWQCYRTLSATPALLSKTVPAAVLAVGCSLPSHME